MPVIEPRVYTYYKSVVCQDLIYTRELHNIMELPKIVQCALNTSSAHFLKNKARGLTAQIALQCISGQKSKATRARKSIATFQLRKDNLLGCTVNVRGVALYSFLDQCFTLACSPMRTPFVAQKHTALDSREKKRNGVQETPSALFNFGGKGLTFFPGLEAHFLLFSTIGGFNCTLGASAAGAQELTLLLTALQFPVQHIS